MASDGVYFAASLLAPNFWSRYTGRKPAIFQLRLRALKFSGARRADAKAARLGGAQQHGEIAYGIDHCYDFDEDHGVFLSCVLRTEPIW